jgi:alkylation response protein AidB-like acyl-CoA dehydrogenase
VNFAFSEEQESFRGELRRCFEEHAPTPALLRAMESEAGFDRAVWKRLAAELGLGGLQLPEAYGGQGFGLLELGIAAEESGRTLFPSPLFATLCLGANAILNAGSEAQKRALLPGIASGETLATLALLEPGKDWDVDSVAMVATPNGDGARLSGEKRFVVDGASADLIVVAARRADTRGQDGIGLFVVRAGARGLDVAPVEALDATRKLAHLRFDDVAAEPLGKPGEDGAPLARTLDQARVMLACENAGGAQHCLDSAVAWAKQRVQFARPIGSFQAIQHKCAEVLLEVESAKSAAHFACWAAEQDEGLPLAAAVAKSFCDEAFLRAAAENLHIHGGVGFSWESDPHLYLKRAKANETLLGAPRFQRERIARELGF